MKILCFVFIGLVYTHISFGQIEKVISEEEETPPPTKVLENSVLNQQSKMKGYELVKLTPSTCDESLMGMPIKERIVRKIYHKDTLEIDVGFSANCCSSFLGEIQVKNDTTLNLIFKEYGMECFCHCCFQLTYHIVTKDQKLTSFELNGKAIIETNQVLKKATHEKEFYPSGKLKKTIHKLDDEIIRVHHYDTRRKMIQIDYYRNGKLHKAVKR